MEKHISEKEYLTARKIVTDYEIQIKEKKLLIYSGLTKDNILSKEINSDGKKTFYFWVTEGDVIPDRDPNGSVTYDYNCDFYTLENSHVPYKTYKEAEKNMLKTFKRKGFIK